MLPLLLALLLGADPQPSVQPLRLAGQAFGRPMEVEVRDLPRAAADEAIRRAFTEVAEMETLIDSGGAALTAAAGKGPQAVDARLLPLLDRAWNFCLWSEGAHGPLGRDLYALSGLRAPVAEPPARERWEEARNRAACNHMALDKARGTANLAAGAGLDFWGFAEGYAVDRAVEALRQRGVSNALVRIGTVHRGFGPGPGDKGWPVRLPQVPGLEEPPGLVYLKDRALAVAAQSDHPQPASGKPPYLNQRRGLPAQSVLMTMTVSHLGIDAQGLATALLIVGPREGQLRIGSLRPRPSVLWFLGSGTGSPLQVDYRWSDVSRGK
jgi:FAD:protein FMN transferase